MHRVMLILDHTTCSIHPTDEEEYLRKKEGKGFDHVQRGSIEGTLSTIVSG